MVQEGESQALLADLFDSEKVFLSELRAASLVSALDSLALTFQCCSSGNSMQTVQRGWLQMLQRPSGTNWQGFFFFFTPPCRAPAPTHGGTQLCKHTDTHIDTCKHFVAFSFCVIYQRNTRQVTYYVCVCVRASMCFRRTYIVAVASTKHFHFQLNTLTSIGCRLSQ